MIMIPRRAALRMGVAGAAATALPCFAIAQSNNRPTITVAVQKVANSNTLDSLNIFRKERDWTAYDRQLADQMSDVVVAFAKTGNPATAAAPIPRYNPKKEQRLVWGDNGYRIETLNEKQIDFIETHKTN